MRQWKHPTIKSQNPVLFLRRAWEGQFVSKDARMPHVDRLEVDGLSTLLAVYVLMEVACVFVEKEMEWSFERKYLFVCESFI